MIKVGCCGFPGGMKKYFEKFELVEVQSTFYRLPRVQTAERWRGTAQEDFEFAVKAWQALTHPPTSPTWRKAGIRVSPEKTDRYGFLRPTEEVFEAWERTKEICNILKAKMCVIQCPASFQATEQNIQNMKGLLSKIDRGELTIAWEPRGRTWTDEKVRSLCEELDLTHCLSPKTKILLEDGSWTTIREIENNWPEQEVVSCDWSSKTLCLSQIVQYVKINPNHKNLRAYEVVTKETNRGIVATEDHPFYTKRGKLLLKELKLGDKVAVYPREGIKSSSKEMENNTIIIVEDDIIKAAPPKSWPNLYIKRLKERNLLPLTTKNKAVSVLARLLGHLFGDGNLVCYYLKKYDRYNVHVVFSGDVEDLKTIKNDINKLGFRISQIMTQYARSEISKAGEKKRIIEGWTKKVGCSSKTLWTFLKALGAPVGDKALKSFRVPLWIKEAPLHIQREFIAAYFGSELKKPIPKSPYRKQFLTPIFTLNKAEGLVKDGLEFVEDLKEILKNFGTRISSISITEGTVRKDGTRTKKIEVILSSELTNLLNLYGKIGYRYCKKREVLARYAFEYLSMKNNILKERRRIYEEVMNLKKKGLGCSEIIQRINKNEERVRPHNIADWFYARRKVNNRSIPRTFPKFDKWVKEAMKGLKDGLVWETIDLIEEVKINDVRDITTAEHFHNFIANGFLVGNCTDPFAREPVFFSRKTAYFRLHGRPPGDRMYYYKYTDPDLEWFLEKVRRLEAKGLNVYCLFNNVYMGEDAQRFIHLIGDESCSKF